MPKLKSNQLIFVATLVAGPLFILAAARRQDEPKKAQSHANRGVAYLEQFRFAEAVAEFEAMVQLEPDSAAAHVNLGIAYFNQREFEKALASLKRAEALAPESPQVHYNLGLIYKLQGSTEQAASAFEKVAAIDPEDSMTQYYLGTVYANLGRLEEAVSRLRTAIRLQPGNESAHFSLGNALIRQGKVEEGRQELEVFRKLKESFPEATSAGLQYTELGKYAEAIEESSPPLQQVALESPVASAVRWVESTEASGLSLLSLAAPAPWPASVPAADYGRAFIESRLLPQIGSGLGLRDLDGDGDPDLVILRGGAPLVFLNEGGRFRPSNETGLPSQGKFVGLAIGDVDNDGDPDLYLAGAGPNGLYLNDGKGRFRDIGPAAGVAGDDISAGATFADVDHDGDLDIYVSNYLDPEPPRAGGLLRVPFDLPGAPNRLYRNNGNGTFTEIGAESRTDGGASRSLNAVFSDFDDDRDIDFLVVNDGQPAQIFSNDRVGSFTEKSIDWGVELSGRMRGAASADFDRDGSFDLFLSAEGAVLNALLRGPARNRFRPDLLSPGLLTAGLPGGRFGTTFLDADNDGDLDLLLVVNEPGVLGAYYENTSSGYRRAGVLASPDPDSGAGRSLAVADVDGDGDQDAALGTDRGRVLFFRNEGGSAGGWIRVEARGLRSNKDGVGTKVEVKAGEARLRREVRSSAGYLSQDELPLHFGLGTKRSADYIRFLWPGGVKQIEMEVAGGRTVSIDELDRKGTSCPILYAWDGREIRFVTDFLGGSAIGYLLSPGIYNYPDTDEYVKLEEFPLLPREGFFDLRWVNQLEEVLMYDRAALLAIDHPEQIEVFPNERLMPAPPYPPARLYAVRELRPPARATDQRGKDVTSLIAAKDRRYPADFKLLPFKGYAELHSLTLDLGPLRAGTETVLLLYGWVDYADSSSNLAAAQAGARLVPPYLEVADDRGHFRPGLASMGFPAGLPKTMLVDLKGLVGPAARKVRITTSMRIYWDQIQVATAAPDAPLRLTELSPDRAELRFRGYPASFRPDDRGPARYDYARASTEELWDSHQGYYTRFGDVRELVKAVDDLYVIARHGDEMALGFDASRLPTLSPGWRRSFLLYADGFGKDMDLNSARPDTVEPLPFHGMSAYPYPPEESYPNTDRHRRYRKTYNMRRVEGGRPGVAGSP